MHFLKLELIIFASNQGLKDLYFRLKWKFMFLFQVYVTKRPHVDEFLRRVGELYECVLFTASLAKVIENENDSFIYANIGICLVCRSCR